MLYIKTIAVLEEDILVLNILIKLHKVRIKTIYRADNIGETYVWAYRQTGVIHITAGA